jgi:Trypsin-like peptidase domain
MRNRLTHSLFLLALGIALTVPDALLAQVLHAPAQSRPAASQRPLNSRLGVADLDRIIQPITTVIEFPDGRRTLKVGSGFIIGRHYITVHHNLASVSSTASARKTVYLDGIPLTPSYTHAEHDIAVFDLPEELCERYCNEMSIGTMPKLTRDQQIYWLRKVQDEFMVQEGRVLNYAFIGDPSGSSDPYGMQGCKANLIVEVDTPFRPGSSGAPVLDTATGRIIGIIQGSLEHAAGHSGYFKPIHCVASLVGSLAKRFRPHL